MKRGFKALLGQANTEIETISVEDAKALVESQDVLFVDVRETLEVQNTGGLPGHIHVPRGLLEFLIDPESPMHKPELSSGRRLVLYCASGGRFNRFIIFFKYFINISQIKIDLRRFKF